MHSAQEIFKFALKTPVTRLRIVFAPAPPVPDHHCLPSQLGVTYQQRKPLPVLPADILDGSGPTTSTPSKDFSTDCFSAPDTIPKSAPGTAHKKPHLSVFKHSVDTAVNHPPSSCMKQAPNTVTKENNGNYTDHQNFKHVAPSTESKSNGSAESSLLPPQLPAKMSSGFLSSNKARFTPLLNTRIIGKKFHIQLTKGL